MNAWLETVNQARAVPSSFYWPIRLMPQPQREAMWVLYAFCHHIDDLADEAGDADALQNWLEWLQGNAERHDALAVAFAELMARYDLPKDYPIALIEAAQQDVRGAMNRPSHAELEAYCYGVASVVGLMTVRILGVQDGSADAYAIALGHAFQRTNILRDVAEDAARGRCYLPSEWEANDWAQLGVEADAYYAQAADAFPVQYASELRATRAMWWIYAALFERIKANGYAPLAEGYRLSKWQKIWYAAGGYLRRA